MRIKSTFLFLVAQCLFVCFFIFFCYFFAYLYFNGENAIPALSVATIFFVLSLAFYIIGKVVARREILKEKQQDELVENIGAKDA